MYSPTSGKPSMPASIVTVVTGQLAGEVLVPLHPPKQPSVAKVRTRRSGKRILCLRSCRTTRAGAVRPANALTSSSPDLSRRSASASRGPRALRTLGRPRRFAPRTAPRAIEPLWVSVDPMCPRRAVGVRQNSAVVRSRLRTRVSSSGHPPSVERFGVHPRAAVRGR
jgi:hypothetical protein